MLTLPIEGGQSPSDPRSRPGGQRPPRGPSELSASGRLVGQSGSEPRVGGVTSQMVSLWIDLVRQAFPSASLAPPTAAGFTAHQLNALDAIAREGAISMSELAQWLRVTESAATALADRLTAAGAIARDRDARDRRVVWVALTASGQKLAATHRDDLEATLQQLLTELEPAKLAAITVAMTQLGDRTQPAAGRSRDRHRGDRAPNADASSRPARVPWR